MSIQISQESAGEIRPEMKSRFDVIKETSGEKRRLRSESGDSQDARAFKRPTKPFIDLDGEVDVYGGMGENDSLGG